MSRDFPIHIIDTDDDPSEDSYHSEASLEAELVPLHPRTSDDSSVDTPPPVAPTVPPVQPEAAPGVRGTWTDFAETSGGLRMRRTPLRVVRDFPTGCFASRGKAPVEPETAPEQPPERARSTRFDWMPVVLREWRSLEGIPSTFETGESSHSAPSSSLTGEPLGLTVPTLVAVIHTLFRMLQDTRSYMRGLQGSIHHSRGEIMTLYERLDFVEVHAVMDRESADVTHLRVDALERRTRMIEIMAWVSVLLVVVMSVVLLFLSYFH